MAGMAGIGLMSRRRAFDNTQDHGLPFFLLGEYTFDKAVGSAGRVRISPQPSWANLDFLMLVPDIVCTDDGQGGRTGNWIFYGMSDGTKSSGDYNGNSSSSFGTNYTGLLQRFSGRKWSFNIINGSRPISITSDADLSQISMTYGPYYGSGYGEFNGKLYVYGGAYAKE